MRSSAGNSLAAWLFRGNHGPFEHFRCIPLYLPCPDRTICSGATLIKKTRANWSAEKRFKLDMVMWCFASWWFGSFFIFHNIWDNPSHWLSYFSRWVKPPTSLSCLYVRFTGCNSDTPVPTSLGTSQTSFRTRRTSQPSLPYVLENILAEALENQKYGTNLQAQMFFFTLRQMGFIAGKIINGGIFQRVPFQVLLQALGEVTITFAEEGKVTPWECDCRSGCPVQAVVLGSGSSLQIQGVSGFQSQS